MNDDPKRETQDAYHKQYVNLLVERELQKVALPIKVIGYMDMLGFGSLVRKHPGSVNIEISPDGSKVDTSTTKASERFARVHAVLDLMAMSHGDSSRPERMMMFSDCAFDVYDDALQAAVSLSHTMRRFLKWSIPVRMCIAKGTCHYERFSIESFQSFNLTRSMFYGSGIVFAVEGEEKSGAGCRIFRLAEIQGEVAAIRGAFPELGGRERGWAKTKAPQPKAPASAAPMPRRRMSAAARKAISQAQKRRWAEKRVG